MYERFALSLYFVDPITEAKYYDYLYRDSGFYGGKICLVTLIFFYASLLAVRMTDTPTALELIVLWILNTLLIAAWVFVAPLCIKYYGKQFWRYLELCMFLSALTIGSSVLSITQERNEENSIPLTYLVPFVHSFAFCTLVPTRFAPMTFATTSFVVIASVLHFVRYHRHSIDVIWYGAYFFIIRLHYVIDLQNRHFFEDIDKCSTQLSNVNATLDTLDSVVMSYLPPTATRDFLLRRDEDVVLIQNTHHTPYPNTVLVV
eukprot:PhM_4_TR8313/c1_g1_i1/m.77741